MTNEDVKTHKEGETYRDVPGREEALKTEEAKELLSSFPENVREAFVECFLSSKEEKEKSDIVSSYLLSNSEMAKLIKVFPGSAEAFEYLYLEKKSEHAFDNFFLKSKAGHQTYRRLLSLDENLPKVIEKIYTNKPLIIDNIFSGPGRDMIRAIENNPSLRTKVNVRNIDIDKNAIAIGERLVKEKKLEDIFSFECKPYKEAEPRFADLIIMVGVLCPLPLDFSKHILGKMKTFSKPGGFIVYSTAQYSLLHDDPLTDFLMRLIGWNMSYKSDEQAWNLATDAGWEPIERFFDEPLHHHCMTFAKLK